jgi:hypothetical protein
MKNKVLWVEDGALVHLPELAAPLYRSGKYDLTLALNASEGLEHLLASEFEAVVVDIRIPPGDQKDWIDIYQAKGNVVEARLGLELLRALFGSSDAKVSLARRPDWLRPDRIAVLTVENWYEVKDELDALGIRFFKQKTTELMQRSLLELVEQIMEIQGKGI